jgi:hypothetical protein
MTGRQLDVSWTSMLPKSIAAYIKGVLILAPPVLIGILIFRNGVDFPVLDEWDGTAPLFEKMANGTLGFGDFFAQHNEHRIFFPRLIFFTLGRLTHWDIRAELWVIWLLALVCLFSIWQLARRTHSVRTSWIPFAASVLLFSPLGVANFLWGFQVGFLLPLACITACIWTTTSVRCPWNFLAAIILCTICTFSIASGFTSWLLITPVLLLVNTQSPSSKKWWVIWCSLFSLELVAYFYGYVKPPYHPPLWWFLAHPITAVEYILLFFGGPFSYGTNLPPNALGLGTGTLLLGLLLVAGFYIWRQRSDRSLVGETLPWVMLAMVTVTSAILMMIGRAGFGPGQARTSRYVPFAAMLPIALVVLMPLVYAHWSRSASTRARFAARGFLIASLVVLIFFNCLGSFTLLPVWPMKRQQRSYEKALVSFINVVPEMDVLEKSVFPFPARVKEAASVLDRIRYLRPPLMRSNQIRSQTEFGNGSLKKTEFGSKSLGKTDLGRDSVGSVTGANGEAAFGAFQFHEEASGSIAADGWAFLPDERRPADAVLITIDNAAARGKPEVCAIAQVGDPRQLAPLRAVWDSSALPSIWNCQFPRARLPQGQHYYLEAWAFNVETLHAYRLQGNALFLW